MMEQPKKNGLTANQNHLPYIHQYKSKQFHGISKEEILLMTNNGLDILNYYFTKLGTELKIGTKIKNPFYKDTKASLIIDLVNGHYVFNDFGDSRYQGDLFGLVGIYFGLDSKYNFVDILKRITDDMQLVIGDYTEKAHIERQIQFKEFSSEEISYWHSFGVNKTTLDKFKVKSVDWFKVTTPYGIKKIANHGYKIFCYQINNDAYKIYQPYNPKYKFSWVGNKPSKYVFGYELLDYSTNTVIIAAGEKDTLCLVSLGYNAICFNSETTVPEASLINQLKSNYENVLVCYDNDATGLREAKKIAGKYSLSVVDISYILGEHIGKDIADYIKSCRELDNMDEYLSLKSAVSNAEAVSDSMNRNIPKPFPLKLYELLPKKITDSLNPYQRHSEKDMMLISLVVMFSGLLPNYYTFYSGKKYESNLFLFVLGKPASGKGSVDDVRALGQPVHDIKLAKTKSGTKLSEKEMLFVPGNSSYASFLALFYANNERITLFETEADVFNDAKGQEWGDYSVALRKSFHQEPISHSRKKENEYFELKSPKLTVIMTGTQDQFNRYFQSPENGLFSRYIIFNLNSNSGWKNVFEYNEKINSFEMLSNWALKAYSYLEENEIEFCFSNEQQKIFNESLSNKSKYYSEIDDSGYLDASLKRMGLIITRLGMIISILEFEDISSITLIHCSEKIFECLMLIFDNLLEHTVLAMTVLPKGLSPRFKSQSKQSEMLFQSLPVNFNRKQAVDVGLSLGIKTDYLDKILRMRSLFEKDGRSCYHKVRMSAESAVL
jgi:hypothetical protein